jgi:hypothetical protein
VEEKLIIISIDNNELDSFNGTVDYLDEYCRNNKINLDNILEFEAFVYVICKWR